MTSTTHSIRLPRRWRATTSVEEGHSAFRILYAGFILLPILAGFDKFTGFLANWSAYLAPVVTGTIPIQPEVLLKVIGVIEIAAGLLVALRPRLGAILVAAWLVAVIANLVVLGQYWDVALRDFGLLLGALSLARLSPRRSL
jgi:uncharacterized membrane protein YphA (DoxX/SURF4 family)